MPTDNNTATDTSMQDVAKAIEERLYGSSTNELGEDNDDEVLEDADQLPDGGDSDSANDTGSDDDADLSQAAADGSLAAFLGVDESRVYEEDGTVYLDAIIDGETKKVPLKDLAVSYQLQGHVNNKSMALEKERQAFEAARTEQIGVLKQKVDGLAGLSKVLEQELLADFNTIDWDRLRVENPAEWTALRQDFAEKAQKVQRAQALIVEEGRRLNEQREAELELQRQQHLSNELQRTLDAFPDWRNPGKLEEAQVSMRNFLTKQYGFSESDMQHVTDHRLVRMIQDAKAYREGIAAVGDKLNKQVPKFSKPDAAKANAAQLAKARESKTLRAKVRQTGSVQDAAKLIENRM